MHVRTAAFFALLVGLILSLFAVFGVAEAQDTAALQEKLKQNPNDVRAIDQYVGTMLRAAFAQMNRDPDAALKKLDELKATVDGLNPDADDAKNLVAKAKVVIKSFRRRIELEKTTLEELAKKLEADPSDAESVRLYGTKVQQIAGMSARSDPEKAEQTLADADKLLATVLEKSSDDAAVAKAVDQARAQWRGIKRMIAAAKKLKELIGKSAAPLTVDAWVNGSPMTDEDLKGKVVLLDFWAVWCGPCVSTFPHLIEWNKKYADKGLVIIGLTNYYGMEWDPEKKSYTRAEEPSEEKEREMLEKFAKAHNLEHRIAVSKDRTLSEFYAVTGIPHVVVIDRHGKIRLIKVGSGPANAEAIEKMIEELIAEKV